VIHVVTVKGNRQIAILHGREYEKDLQKFSYGKSLHHVLSLII